MLASSLPGATIVYDSIDPTTILSLSYSANGLIAAGNHVTLDPGNPIVEVAVDLFNEHSGTVTADVRLTLYAFALGPNPVGAQLGQYTLSAVNFGALASYLAIFDLSASPVTLPIDVIWTIEFLNATNNTLGLSYSSGPLAGGVDDNYPFFNTGSGLAPVNFTAFGGEIYGARFTASSVPEPSTWMMIGAGAMALLVRRKRRS